jgi:hypothetical protein
MRWYAVLLLFVVAGCTSTWERHESLLAEQEERGEYAQATATARWLVDNAFYQASPTERTPAAEAARYLRLSRLAAKAGDVHAAVEALRDALTADPSHAAAVRERLERLPLSDSERARLKREFAWNIAALAPSDDALLEEQSDGAQCWSYRVREVRVRHQRIVQTAEGPERQATYDARSWVFDVSAGRWYPDGGWIADAGTEVELLSGPDQPRYRAVVAADQRFYTDDTVPPCHRAGWQGPYDPKGTVYVAAQLPERHASAP